MYIYDLKIFNLQGFPVIPTPLDHILRQYMEGTFDGGSKRNWIGTESLVPGPTPQGSSTA